ncbi:flagellar hook basal-body protein [Alicyclobacillus tolerans]|uniref:flagellar hook-basal body protein n=1 Tax=Alicyclobacillus tolerans TaxID=90970 RepID=UPI001F2D6501|nr:flagellar hook basal-body protein [Alicyclobacillus tolerans]MCF8568061.1 flagellar hook basal-body protein [Alicyclobacillus tolerans]
MQALWNSLSALQSSMSWLNRTANNIANSNTVGYAEQNVSFADALTRSLAGSATAGPVAARYTAPGWWGGTGVLAGRMESNFAQMPISQTGDPTDLAVQGSGFFSVAGPNRQMYLTKAGNFQLSKQSNGTFVLATPSGYPVLDTLGNPVTLTSSQFAVQSDGQIVQNGKPVQKIAIVGVSLPTESLISIGNNVYQPNAVANPVVLNQKNTPGSSASIVQGALNQSNVDLTSEMPKLLEAQNMYSMSSRAMQITNQMMQAASTIQP